MSKPTGRKRYRVITKGLLRKKHLLVLQFEFEGDKIQYISGWVDHYHTTWWVDATPEMLTETGSKVDEPC